MAIFVLIVVIIVIIHTVIEGIQKRKLRKGWVSGVEYSRDMHADIWIVARITSDPERKEFKVRYDPYDGHFYDMDNTGYHATEIYIKKAEDG
jgi:hypothetical protein